MPSLIHIISFLLDFDKETQAPGFGCLTWTFNSYALDAFASLDKD